MTSIESTAEQDRERLSLAPAKVAGFCKAIERQEKNFTSDHVEAGAKFVSKSWFYKEGKIRAIGVANFEEKHLEKLRLQTEIVPMVDQVQTTPFKQQIDLHAYLVKNDIQHIGWGPFGQGDQSLFSNPVLTEIGDNYGKSTAQVILRWNVERDIGVITKSINPERLMQNSNIFDFSLSMEDMEKITSLNMNKKQYNDPNNKVFSLLLVLLSNH